MTTLNSVLPESGIFTAIDTVKPFPWRDIITPSQMDATYKALFTNKPISKLVKLLLGDNSTLTEDNISVLANYLYVLYYEKWSLIYGIYSKRATIFDNGYSETVTETITHDYNTTDTGTTKNTNTETGKISAYNSSDFQDKDQTNNTGTNTRDLAGTDTGTQGRTYTKTGYGENYIDAYEKYISALKSDLLYGIIFVDANSVLARHVYNLYE